VWAPSEKRRGRSRERAPELGGVTAIVFYGSCFFGALLAIVQRVTGLGRACHGAGPVSTEKRGKR
jgi:hypothetical protein